MKFAGFTAAVLIKKGDYPFNDFEGLTRTVPLIRDATERPQYDFAPKTRQRIPDHISVKVVQIVWEKARSRQPLQDPRPVLHRPTD